MSKKFKPYISVTVLYEGYDTSFDSKLTALAKKHDGNPGGGGCGMAQRDLDFEFTDLQNAAAFLKAAYKFKKIKHIYSDSHLYDNDYRY